MSNKYIIEYHTKINTEISYSWTSFGYWINFQKWYNLVSFLCIVTPHKFYCRVLVLEIMSNSFVFLSEMVMSTFCFLVIIDIHFKNKNFTRTIKKCQWIHSEHLKVCCFLNILILRRNSRQDYVSVFVWENIYLTFALIH